MSVDVYVEAHRKVSQADMEYVIIYNSLIAKGIKPPEKVIEYLRGVLGDDDRFSWNEEIDVPSDAETVTIRVLGTGNAKCGEGMIVRLADLPSETEALRIYME